MDGAAAFGLALLAASAALVVHYEVLRLTLVLAPRPGVPVRLRMLGAMGALLTAHGVCIALYGALAWAMDGRLGSFAGDRPPTTLADHLYVSAVTYTCVGCGDAYPVGAMRALVAVESLNGLVLIGWSATFDYLLMQRLWLEDPTVRDRVLGQAPLQRGLLRGSGEAAAPDLSLVPPHPQPYQERPAA